MTASIVLDLDTTPPQVIADAVSQVEPPASWEVSLEANEEIGGVSLAFLDGLGDLHWVGWSFTSAQTVYVLVPTVGLSGGAGMLVGTVSDTVGNEATIHVPLSVNWVGGSDFDATLEIGPTLEAQQTLDHAFEVEQTSGWGLDVEATLDHAFEADLTLET